MTKESGAGSYGRPGGATGSGRPGHGGARLDHIGVAVRDADAAARFYTEVLGLEESGRETVATQGIKIVFVPAGDSRVELLEPLGPESSVARFLETRGEGLHHVAFAVDDIEAALARAKAAGYDLIDAKPRVGAGGARIAFLHPKGLRGVLVELCEHGRDE